MTVNYVEIARSINELSLELARLSAKPTSTPTVAWPEAGFGLDLLISPNELNLHHGTGVLMNKIFSPEASVNIKSHEHYSEKGPFRSYKIDLEGLSRPAVYSHVLKSLSKESINRIVCVPYFPEDFLAGIAAKTLLGVPMIVWIMDDQIVNHAAVSKDLATELFELADIRFAISPEMRDAYETKFQRKFFVLPPTVDAKLLNSSSQADFSENLSSKTCAMIGNIWSKAWFDKLTEIIKESGWTVHWYGRGSSCGWLDTNPDKLGKCNIIEKGFLAEDSLATALKRYPFTIVPTGTGEADDSHQGVTLLSLPTRMPFILAAACTPMLVIGTPKSCSARFISRFGVGMSIGYDKTEFAQAVERLSDASFQSKCRDNAVSSANIFSNTDLADWMWASCARQSPVSDRFEKPFRRQPGTLVNYYESPAPRDLYGDFQLVYQSLHRIARYGYEPDFVIDVGASSGVWSDAVNRVFPNARFILIEPLPDRYPKWFHEKHPKFEWVAAAASNESGKASFQVSSDIYGSSLLQPNDNREYTSLEVPIVTLDSIYTQKQIRGRGIVKIDVQFAEHLVIDGSTELLKLIDFVILELTIERSIPTAKTFLEMVTHMSSLGFRYFDDTGEWRNPINGMLEQKDVLFVREDRASEILNS